MISFSEPDKVEHEFEFSARQDKQTVLDQINATQYHSKLTISYCTDLYIYYRVYITDLRVTNTLLFITLSHS